MFLHALLFFLLGTSVFAAPVDGTSGAYAGYWYPAETTLPVSGIMLIFSQVSGVSHMHHSRPQMLLRLSVQLKCMVANCSRMVHSTRVKARGLELPLTGMILSALSLPLMYSGVGFQQSVPIFFAIWLRCLITSQKYRPSTDFLVIRGRSGQELAFDSPSLAGLASHPIQEWVGRYWHKVSSSTLVSK